MGEGGASNASAGAAREADMPAFLVNVSGGPGASEGGSRANDSGRDAARSDRADDRSGTGAAGRTGGARVVEINASGRSWLFWPVAAIAVVAILMIGLLVLVIAIPLLVLILVLRLIGRVIRRVVGRRVRIEPPTADVRHDDLRRNVRVIGRDPRGDD
jgi:hypothetical protein